jgi:hypothetical protein
MCPAHALVRSVLMIAAMTLLAPASADAKPKKGAAASAKEKKKPTEIKMPKSDTPAVDDVSADNSSAPPPTRGPTRIDFDDRLIQGQTNKSGAVYLYDRKELKTRSMIKARDSFREEIITSVYDG